MAIDFGRKALSKLSGFLSSAKISRCASPPLRDGAAATASAGGGELSCGMEAEFDEIEQSQDWNRVYSELRGRAEFQNGPFRAARKPENRKLNRYTDVLPFDHSRVILSRGETDYINANTVTYDRAKRAYVLTQGPLEETVGHFWLMVWEQKVPTIVMLNKIIEKQRIKCHKYWPDADEPLEIAELQLTVHLLSEDENENFVRRAFKLSDSTTSESREVVQFQYTEWPDFGIPQCPDEFLKFLDLVRGSGLLSCEKGPPVIHCSAGIGRSGTFCLVDVILKMLEDGTVKDNGDIDIKEILLELRKNRIGLIQTADQLKFAYMVLIEGVKRKNGGSNQDNMETDTEKKNNGTTVELIQCETEEEERETNEQDSDRDEDPEESKKNHDDDDEEAEEEEVKMRVDVAETRLRSPGKASKSTNTNGPELEAETTQDGTTQKDEELQTEPEEELEEEPEEGEEDDGSSPQKRAHHRLSLNTSDLKEEPTLKRNKSQDE